MIYGAIIFQLNKNSMKVRIIGLAQKLINNNLHFRLNYKSQLFKH